MFLLRNNLVAEVTTISFSGCIIFLLSLLQGTWGLRLPEHYSPVFLQNHQKEGPGVQMIDNWVPGIVHERIITLPSLGNIS